MVLIWKLPCAWNADEWRQQAACCFSETDLFFPIGVTGPAGRQIEAAKAVCRGCPVQAECLDFALVTNQEAGVWGGTSEEQRRRLRPTWLAGRRGTDRTTGLGVRATPAD